MLILNTLGYLSSPGVARVDDAIVTALGNSPFQIELYSEDMEATLFSDEAVQQEFQKWYIHKYRDRKPDVIIAVGLEPLKFMVDAHEKYFPGIPVVFCGTTREMLGHLRLASDFTGVWAVAQPERTLKAALALQAGTRHVVVVGGVGEYDRYLEAIAKESFRKYESSFQFTYLTDLDMPTLVERLKHLPDHTIVYHTSIMQDASGTRFIDASQAVPIVAGAANAPVFVVDDVDVGRGTEGGYVLSFEMVGQSVGEMALRILRGERPQNIPIMDSPNLYMFDWRALQRWGLKESNLPPGSVVLNRQPTVWESFGWYILGGTALILLEGLLIFALVWQRATRRKVETELEITYDRLRGVVASAMDAIIAVDEQQQIVLFNPAAEKMFGCTSQEAVGAIERFIPQRFRSEHKEYMRRFGESGVTKRAMGALGTLFGVRANGEEFPIEASISHVHADGAQFFTVTIRDITERKRAEEAVRESEQRFRLVANTAPVMIWMSGTDKLCTYFNQPWLKFTGRPHEAELGNGWAEGVHQEDLKRCLDTYTQAFDRHESFQMRYRLRRQDGEYRWVLDIGVPRFNHDGSFAGYIGSCLDITDQKFAEEALASVSRRLIEAHEQERTWIARELHDDINQQIALLAIELERWGLQVPGSQTDVHAHIRHAGQRLSEIGKDVQSLSHRLHSSKLEYLGIVMAASSFCKEISQQQKVEVQFIHSDIPHTVPNDIALCLFRVLQEALQNAVKHSGARQFHVELRGTSEEIRLTVSDPGVGFDWHGALDRQGLGLISMRERLQLVSGEFSIESEPGRGATIHARVPLRTNEDRVRMAG